MNDKKLLTLADLESYRQRQQLTQSDLAVALSISQGDLSKVMAGRVRLSVKLRRKIRALVGGFSVDGDSIQELEVVRLFRTSDAFRKLMQAAIEMHNRHKN